jgi:carboxylesterase
VIACLLIHGFTGGEYEIAPLDIFLREHGVHTRTFTLRGHGGSRKDMINIGREDWIQGAEDELVNLLQKHETVHLIGFSTGALIAANLSVKYAQQVRTLTMLSTPVFPLNLHEIMKTLLRIDMLKVYIKNLFIVPPRSSREFYRIVSESFDIFPKVMVPVLIVQGTSDHLVKRRSGSYLYENLGSTHKKLLMAEKSDHMVCYSIGCSKVFGEVLSWVKNGR